MGDLKEMRVNFYGIFTCRNSRRGHGIYSKALSCMGPLQMEPTLAAALPRDFSPRPQTLLGRHGWSAGWRPCRGAGDRPWGELLPQSADARHGCGGGEVEQLSLSLAERVGFEGSAVHGAVSMACRCFGLSPSASGCAASIRLRFLLSFVIPLLCRSQLALFWFSRDLLLFSFCISSFPDILKHSFQREKLARLGTFVCCKSSGGRVLLRMLFICRLECVLLCLGSLCWLLHDSSIRKKKNRESFLQANRTWLFP